jgi:uncharacterized membrane protein YidH (DUF202 family)
MCKSEFHRLIILIYFLSSNKYSEIVAHSPNSRRPDVRNVLLSRPLLGALVFENVASDARDHLANERTFLSWLRLSIYLAVVSSAIVISFHLRSQPSETERHIALPLGLVLWIMSLACLISGFSIYLRTVTKYSRKAALVQSGWKTQIFFTVIATVIIGCCVLFLSTNPRK